jgi:diguanylate cyclase (GGDEF)-like protein/PAS domain S-box-containing protein
MFAHFARLSIRTQLILLVLIVLVPAFAAFIKGLADERQGAREAAYAQLKIQVDITAASLRAFFDSNEVLLGRLAQRPKVRQLNARNCDPMLKDYASLHPEFANVVVRDLAGTNDCSVLPGDVTQEKLLTNPWFQQALQGSAFQVGDAFVGPRSGRWVYVMSQPIRDDAGKKTGLLYVPADLLNLNRKLLGAVPPGVHVTVTDGARRIVLRSADPEKWVGQAMAAQIPSTTRGQTAGDAEGVGADGVRRLYAFTELPGVGWRVAASVGEDEAFAASDAAFRRGIVAGLGILLLALALAWRIGLGLLRPIESLARTVKKLVEGDITARAPLVAGPVEIELVAQEFNRMLEVRASSEASLASSEENLAITLQSIGDAVIATDAGGLITRMNPAAERLTGWPLADATGRSLQEVFHIVNDQTHRPVTDPVQVVMATGTVVGLANHTVLLARDGQAHQISDSAAPIRDAAGRIVGVVLVFSDVGEQYRVQESLRVKEQRLRFLLSRTSAVIRTGSACGDFGMTFVSDSVRDLLGYDPAQFVADPGFWDAHVHPDDAACLVAARSALFENDQVVHEYRFRHHNGTYRWLLDEIRLFRDARGQPTELIGVWIDITERKVADAALKESQERYRVLVEGSPVGIAVHRRGRLVYVNPAAIRMVGARGADELVDKPILELVHPDHREAVMQRVRDALERGIDEPLAEEKFLRLDGRTIDVETQGTVLFYDGEPAVQVSFQDISVRKQMAAQIHQLAFYDALTELPNRRFLMERLKIAILTSARHRLHGALLFIDLDNFKSLNDTLGHDIGDLLLQQVAQRLMACVREADTVARLGGDEFVLMIEDLSEDVQAAALQAEVIGQKILDAFSLPFTLNDREHLSTPSIGIALFGENASGVDEMLKQADLAMYQAKAGGRNTLRFFDASMQSAVEHRVALEDDLRDGLCRQEMLLHYQPVVQGDGRVTGAEALVRWQQPRRGLVPPGEFIGLAEATGLILPLGQWVLHTACAQLAAWAADPELAHLTMAVNVSANQFRERNFVEKVNAALGQTGANPHRLKLELTESLLADNVEDIIAKMTALRARGVSFSLDDFGTGYSSLSYLKRLPLSQLKIDQSFVRDVLTDPNDAAIARTIVLLGQSLGLAVIAEGVETDGQRQFLADNGCLVYQGYFFSRPLPIELFEAFVLREA